MNQFLLHLTDTVRSIEFFYHLTKFQLLLYYSGECIFLSHVVCHFARDPHNDGYLPKYIPRIHVSYPYDIRLINSYTRKMHMKNSNYHHIFFHLSMCMFLFHAYCYLSTYLRTFYRQAKCILQTHLSCFRTNHQHSGSRHSKCKSRDHAFFLPCNNLNI